MAQHMMLLVVVVVMPKAHIGVLVRASADPLVHEGGASESAPATSTGYLDRTPGS